MACKKRVDLSFDVKLQVLDALENPGATMMKVAEKFNISKSQVGRRKQSKESLRELQQSPSILGKKRKRDQEQNHVGGALAHWMTDKVVQGACLSGHLLKKKVTELAESKGESFNPSNGWLYRRKQKNGVAFKKEHGEKQAANFAAAQAWRDDELLKILDAFEPCNETGLYFRGFPDRGHCSESTELTGGKKAMERITLLLCANMTGEEKLPVFVIGKSKQPRSFPKDLSKLPVRYRNPANAWMTGFLFKEWLYEWDNKLKIQDRRVLLLVDKCTAHPAVDDLEMITLKFLPANTTSLLQPMDMGVIKNFKGHYRSRLNDRFIASLDANPDEKAIDISKKITLLNALYLARGAWKELKPSTIVNCYSKAGLSACATEEEADMDDFHDVAINSALRSEEFGKHHANTESI
ncbi:tigger transposable element-derived protein 3-like [Elysia marginata]|uniref:Tigger transposable element-derived protein 3-like n=1 Tax=Elysia marginata TaxID=1093978 RepID=A0AAV4EJG7_9GAST|nr:tigger transposable element-derived protein 3-like [Elysia marginata]